jgi:hypothetical protein
MLDLFLVWTGWVRLQIVLSIIFTTPENRIALVFSPWLLCAVADPKILTGLYNATVAQLAYNSTFDNGTARPQLVLRTTSQSRMENTQISWALGFFGPSFEAVPSPTLANWTDPFRVVVIPEGGTENNSLASYDSKHWHESKINSCGSITDQGLF